MSQNPIIFCAIDTPDLERARDLARMIAPVTGGIKLGLEFFNAFGMQGVESVLESCPDAALFLDLKYHDIPNTVAGAVRAVTANLSPAYLNVHATGGQPMMEAAQEACPPSTKLLSVTILTSIDQDTLSNAGFTGSIADNVERLARLTRTSGLSGVVCSALEIDILRKACGEDFVLMVPGIRPAGSEAGDQARVMTPKDALTAGATHLVIGRPITGAPDPARAAQDILDNL